MLPRARKVEPKTWYGITNKADCAQVHIYNDIGEYGITASQFCQDLAAIDASAIEVRINSRGGDVFDGIAIHGALQRHPADVHVIVDGVAASIASVIAMAGDRVTMARGSSMMIHEAHTAAAGPAAHMRAQAAVLDKASDQIAGFYKARAGGELPQWRARMEKETWYDADEAVKAGLADEVAAPSRQVRASMDLSVFNFAGRAAAPAPDLEPVAPKPTATSPRARVKPTPEPQPVLATTTADPILGALLTTVSPDPVLYALLEGSK